MKKKPDYKAVVYAAWVLSESIRNYGGHSGKSLSMEVALEDWDFLWPKREEKIDKKHKGKND